MEKELDLYTDYFLSSFGQVTATGLSRLLDGSISHDKFTRLLSDNAFNSKDLWKGVKDLVRQHETQDACLIFDDTLIHKPYTDENDVWFSSSNNMLFTNKMEKYFPMDVKSNRLCMFAQEDSNKGRWSSIDKLPLTPEQAVKIWLKDLEIPVLLCKLVFTNKDGSTGEMYLVTNNLQLPSSDFETLYKKRWSVEEYHKSLKQNMALSKSPTRTVATQCNHLFASLLAYVKMERLKFVHKLNHFSLKAKIYLAATKQAFLEYNKLKNFKPA